ncbi:multidrug effflux MFS transporter [Actinokineospora pegani]|uniref:multidrug effflux MFS transporter n=1 Tax=Actinokineospora pegani TaxID=2654637 RepID=UPI0012EAC119|nr:multidrug effflux MFS transporter [Actinokineospora pegani]
MENPTLSAPSSGTSAPAPTGRARLRVILVLGALIALGPLTIDMYLPALPALSSDLAASSSSVQLTLTGTLLGLAIGQLLIGPMSDALGRRKPLIAGVVVHVVASLLCLIAPNVLILGLVRVLQGVGAAAAMVVALAVVRDLFTGRAAATVMSRLMLVMGAAPILAPSLGAAVLLAGSWRWVFAVLALLGAILTVVAVVGLTETLPEDRRSPATVRSVLGNYRTLLADREFVVLALTSAMGMSALMAYVSGSSFVLQGGYGLDQQQFGFVFALGAVAIIGAAQVNVVLLRRWTAEVIVQRSLSAAVVAGAVFVLVSATGFGGLIGFLTTLTFLLAAVGFVLPNSPALALSRHGEAAGTAAALLGATQFGIGALVAPLVGVLGNDALAMSATMTAGVIVSWAALTTTSRTRTRARLATA